MGDTVHISALRAVTGRVQRLPPKALCAFLRPFSLPFSLPFPSVALRVLSCPFLFFPCFLVSVLNPFFLFSCFFCVCCFAPSSFLPSWLVCWRAGLLASWLPCPYASLCLLIVPVLPCASLYCLAWCLASLLPSSLTFFLAVFLCFP